MCVFFLNELFTFVIMCVCGFFLLCCTALFMPFCCGLCFELFFGGGGAYLLTKGKPFFGL